MTLNELLASVATLAARVRGYSGRTYNKDTEPQGLDGPGGMRRNFVPSLHDHAAGLVLMGNALQLAAQHAASAGAARDATAQFVADVNAANDLAVEAMAQIAFNTDALKRAAETAAGNAQAAAAAVNLPTLVPGDEGKVLVVKPDRSGYETGARAATDLANVTNADFLAKAEEAGVGGGFTAVTPKVATFAVAPADLGTLFACAGTVTVTLGAAATLGDLFYCGVSNTGNGTITVLASGAERINGKDRVVLAPGQGAMIVGDGAAFCAIGAAAQATSTGYAMGGVNAMNASLTGYASIETYNFDTKAVGTTTAALAVARQPGGGINSAERGFALGGAPSYGAYSTEIDGFTFATAAQYNPSAVLSEGIFSCGAVHTLSKGFLLGGQRATGNAIANFVSKYDMGSDTASAGGFTLATAVSGPVAVNGPAYGYNLGGYTAGGGTAAIQGIKFSDETSRPVTATMPSIGSSGVGVNSAVRGYAMNYRGDLGNAGASVVHGFVFATESTASVSAVLTNNRRYGAGVNNEFVGMVLAGNNDTTLLTTVDGIDFTSEAQITTATALATARTGTAGVQSGGLV